MFPVSPSTQLAVSSATGHHETRDEAFRVHPWRSNVHIANGFISFLLFDEIHEDLGM